MAVRPKSPLANFYLGFSLHYHARGKLNEAIEYYRTAIELDSNNAPISLFGPAHSGKFGEAFVHFRKASELRPTDPNPLNGVAWELAVRHDPRLRDLAEALTLAKKVVDLSLAQGTTGISPAGNGSATTGTRSAWPTTGPAT